MVTPVVATGERIRVSVKASVRDPDLLLVRVLAPGRTLPDGAHEAWLTPNSDGIDLLKLKN
ncbi:MAG: hypothetical protein HRU17_17770 [Polyangiaceae bacterium]|nr:hypothetical protein [Polyangiaceae bacterium]